MALQEDRARRPAAAAPESFDGAHKFEEIRKRAKAMKFSDRELMELSGVPRTTWRRYTAGKFGGAVAFDRNLSALAAALDGEERRLIRVLKEKRSRNG